MDFFEGDKSRSITHAGRTYSHPAARAVKLPPANARRPAPGWPGVLLHEAVATDSKLISIAENISLRRAYRTTSGESEGHRSRQRSDAGPPRQPECRRRRNTHARDRPDRKWHPEGVFSPTKLNGPPDGHAEQGSGTSAELPPHPHAAHDQHLHGSNGDDMPGRHYQSVKRGLYAVNFGGGSVDITNRKFVFSASEAYLIEDGIVTRPVKGATLIATPRSIEVMYRWLEMTSLWTRDLAPAQVRTKSCRSA